MGRVGASTPGERIEMLDALRGLSLFGILLANILYWSGWIFLTPEQQQELAGPQGSFWLFQQTLIDGKFYTIFTLLFGIGFAVQLDRLEKRGADGVRIYRRRLTILLGIGLVHLMLIWDGDILTFYALVGLLLPYFRNWSGRALLGAAALLIFIVPFAGRQLFEALGWHPLQVSAALSDRIMAALGGTASDPVGWLRREDPYSFFAWVMGGWPYGIGVRLESWRIPKLLGIMLLGLWLGRRLIAGELLGDRRLLLATLAIGTVIGLPLSLAYGLTPGLDQASLPSLLGTVPLGLAYAAGFALLWPRAQGSLRFLIAPGRMALTNYLSQTLAGIVIFYGIGFGLIGRVPPLGVYAIAALIFACQVAFSHWWLARYEQGPMERLWRIGTYGLRARARMA